MRKRIRKRLSGVHALYATRFDDLTLAAKEEAEQERERGGKGRLEQNKI